MSNEKKGFTKMPAFLRRHFKPNTEASSRDEESDDSDTESSELAKALECPICMTRMVETRVLYPCGHTFCSKCIAVVMTQVKDKKIGIACPVCRTFTVKNNIKKNRTMDQVIQLIYPVKTSQTDDRESKVSLVYCKYHPKEKIVMNCKVCEVVICKVCKFEKHDLHKSEPVDVALDRYMLPMHKIADKVNSNSTRTQKMVETLMTEENRLQTIKDDVLEDICKRRNELLIEIEENFIKLSQTFSKDTNLLLYDVENNLKVAKSEVERLNELSSQINTSMNDENKTDLLMKLQSGLLQHWENQASNNNLQLPNTTVNFKFSQTVNYGNLLGSVTTKMPKNKLTFKDSVYNDPDFKTNTNIMKVEKYIPIRDNDNRRICVLNDMLYIVSCRGIEIYRQTGCFEKRLNSSRLIRFGNQNTINSISTINTEEGEGIVIATTKGLFQLNSDHEPGHAFFTDGNFVDVHAGKTYIAAIKKWEDGVKHSLHVWLVRDFSYCGKVLIRKAVHSVIVHRNCVYVTCHNSVERRVYKYNIEANFAVKKFKFKRTAGEKNRHQICLIDSDDELIIGDSGNFCFPRLILPREVKCQEKVGDPRTAESRNSSHEAGTYAGESLNQTPTTRANAGDGLGFHNNRNVNDGYTGENVRRHSRFSNITFLHPNTEINQSARENRDTDTSDTAESSRTNTDRSDYEESVYEEVDGEEDDGDADNYTLDEDSTPWPTSYAEFFASQGYREFCREGREGIMYWARHEQARLLYEDTDPLQQESIWRQLRKPEGQLAYINELRRFETWSTHQQASSSVANDCVICVDHPIDAVFVGKTLFVLYESGYVLKAK